MIQYGLISKVDSAVLEKTIDLICDEFPSDIIRYTEVGLYNCATALGIHNYISSKYRSVTVVGIDNEKDKPIDAPFWLHYIKGNSNEVYNQLEDNSQHLILIDGNHSFPYVISDYYCYKNKVKIGGYLAFHDAAPQAQGKDWQRMGDENDRDMCISVEKALMSIGLTNPIKQFYLGWTPVFYEYDENDRCGGIVVFKKVK